MRDAAKNAAQEAAAEAACDPEVQAALQDATQRQVRQAAGHAKEAYCTSAREYWALTTSRPRIRMQACSCRRDDWSVAFGEWNVLWCQTQMVVFVSAVVLLMWDLLQAFDLVPFLRRVVFCFFHLVWSLFIGHLGWHCLVARQGCCGGLGYTLWACIYVITALWPFVDMLLHSYETIANWCYVAPCLPGAYLGLSCWKLKGDFSVMRMLGIGADNPAQSSELATVAALRGDVQQAGPPA
mmetsp:Transcript_13260/g.35522  ORF Transcript_13260/g.35522 Transcript_13260/m.35522 type:complete len:239 (-) Transcript_13260:44-760(-)